MPFKRKDKEKVGLRFLETMSGYLAEGVADFEEGAKKGQEQGNSLSLDVAIEIKSVSDFIKLSGQEAKMSGTVSYKPLGQNLPIRNGVFTLFKPDPASGTRQMTYSFGFTGRDGNDYFLHGHKVIHDDPGVDVLEDMTRLFTRIYHGGRIDRAPIGSGILTFRLLDFPSMLASFEVTNTLSPITKLRTISAFVKFCYGEIREAYLPGPVYRTRYENLVLRGKIVSKEGDLRNFFFFSGIHGKDFPWGDDEVFWDIALVIQKSDGGWERYVLTDRIIENLKLDVEKGVYRYEGPVYQLVQGYSVSKADLEKSILPGHLRKMDAQIEILFNCKPYFTVDIPFPIVSNFEKLIPRQNREQMEELLRRIGVLGLHLTPNKVRISEGQITLKDDSKKETFILETTQTTGEAEISTLNNIRWPTLYYNYFCALNPESDQIYVKVRSDVFRKNRTDYLKDKLEQLLGKIISHLASVDLDIQGDQSRVLSKDEAISFKMVDENLLEINNDHFPTATFQRRVVAMTDDKGKMFYALEEDMDPHILRSIHSDKSVKVAAIRDSDKFNAMKSVLEATEFFPKLDKACESSGKSKEDFAIIVKPNFMFMYSTKDPSTYTDPQLVEYLVSALYDRGYRNLAVAEARSTYGTFFTNREVRTVAEFIGLRGRNYRIIDLSEDLEEFQYSGKLGRHYVNRDWKNADFRISFAKNKTHIYTYYTLTIKDIYGALPMENKFLEYHHERDIFSTTIEFIKHFPIHFGFIDGHVSADGPFGIFADKDPNKTETIIGSEDIVAADWVGAEKMGLDPMISDYMKQAVEAFGKPQIGLVGDRTIYPDWVNVWDVFPPFLFKGLDKHYYFGNLFYSVFSYMDPKFQYKDPSLARRFLRLLTDPITDLFFQKTKEGVFDPDLNRKLYELVQPHAKDLRGVVRC
jgi:uncharacterized protein (DUF362 family)